MFSLVLQALADAGRLGAVRDRTHRELRREPPYADANERERFARLAEIAEEQLFAPTPVAAERISRALEDGEALIAALAHPAGNRA